MNISSVRFLLSAARWDDLPSDGMPEIAFLGRSNVGKSSLINMLVGRRAIARTSHTPGKTRLFNYYVVNERIYLVDLPGIGYAKAGKVERLRWSEMIERYVEERTTLRVLFHLVDARHDPMAYDEAVMTAVRGLPLSYVVVLTKGDKLSANQRFKSKARTVSVLAGYGIEAPVVMSSAETKLGREELLDWVDKLT